MAIIVVRIMSQYEMNGCSPKVLRQFSLRFDGTNRNLPCAVNCFVTLVIFFMKFMAATRCYIEVVFPIINNAEFIYFPQSHN